MATIRHRVSLRAAGSGLALLALAASAQALTLSSPAFEEGAVIPDAFTFSLGGQCAGANQSPPLVISQVPAGTLSLAVTMFDPDGGDWLHWKAWNIAPDVTALGADASRTQQPAMAQGVNDFGTQGYGGPCPPTPAHRYIFTVYALNKTFDAEPTLPQLLASSVQTATLRGMRSPSDRLAWAPPSRQACLFNWVERQLPEYVAPRGAATQQLAGIDVRHYAQTQSYLGITTEGEQRLYFLSAPTGLLDLGAAQPWATLAACP